MEKEWIYVGVFLDEESKQTVINRVKDAVGIPDGWKIYNDHLTLVFNDETEKSEEVYRLYSDRVGDTIDLVGGSLGLSSDAIAIGIEYDNVCVNNHPHVTVATAPGTPPVRSNDIKTWTILKDKLNLRGTIRIFKPFAKRHV